MGSNTNSRFLDTIIFRCKTEVSSFFTRLHSTLTFDFLHHEDFIFKGGWYILKNWNKEDFDSRNTLVDLHVKYDTKAYFTISVIPNPLSPSGSTITISPGGLGLPDRQLYYTNEDVNCNYQMSLYTSFSCSTGAASLHAIYQGRGDKPQRHRVGCGSVWPRHLQLREAHC